MHAKSGPTPRSPAEEEEENYVSGVELPSGMLYGAPLLQCPRGEETASGQQIEPSPESG